MKYKKTFLFIIASLIAMSTAGFVYADNNYGLSDTATAAGLAKGDVTTIIGNIIGTGLSMITVVFFILMIYGGIMWMTDRGKGEQSKKALDTIWAAIIGIIIVLSAYALTNFVFSSVGSSGSTPPGPTTTGSCKQLSNIASLCTASGSDNNCNDTFCTENNESPPECVPGFNVCNDAKQSECTADQGCEWK